MKCHRKLQRILLWDLEDSNLKSKQFTPQWTTMDHMLCVGCTWLHRFQWCTFFVADIERHWSMICIKHQGDVQGKHCFFLPEPNSQRWNNDLLQVGKIRISSLTISFNVSVIGSEVDVQTLSSENREHCHAACPQDISRSWKPTADIY